MVRKFGILNLTPDSFSDGSEEIMDPQNALKKAQSLIESGADIIDVGAESTRPDASELEDAEELGRLTPFLDLLVKNDWQYPLSIDSRKPEVIRKVLESYGSSCNIQYINDVEGLQNPEMAKVIGDYITKHGSLNNTACNLKIIIMHSKGGIPPPKSKNIRDDFYGEQGLWNHMQEFFENSIAIAELHGIKKSSLVLDPGLGFGKNPKQSLELLELIPKLKSHFNLPVFIGASRKSFLRELDLKNDDSGFILKNGNSCDKSQSYSNDELDHLTSIYNKLALERGADYLRLHAIS